MLKVLIADDEYKVAFLIKSLIEWEKRGLSFAGIVQDGETAYQKICELSPDIVITDIRMPGLSGLDLIRRCAEEGRKTHFIVISGYQYFDYAQKAIRYGVEDYLLKPVDETELDQILAKIAAGEAQRMQDIREADDLSQKLKNSRYILHREFLHALSEETGERNASLEDANRAFSLNFREGLFQVICMKLDWEPGGERNERQTELILKKLGQLAEEKLSALTDDMAVSHQKELSVTAVLNYQADKRQEMETATEALFQTAANYLSGFERCSLTMGVSALYQQFSALHQAVEGAREAAARRILEGGGRLIRETEMDRSGSVCAEEICQAVTEQLLHAAEALRYEDIRHVIRTAFHTAREKNAFASEYQELAYRLLCAYARGSAFKEAVFLERRLSDWQDTLSSLGSLNAIIQFTENSICSDLEADSRRMQERERRPVLRAMEYVRENYRQKLSLEEISEQSGFNMNYFSELFKKETGKTFTAYLLDVRMEEAKKLLRDTAAPVYEVAERVGYKDAKFFSQQFVKTVGLKPAEYRKLYY